MADALHSMTDIGVDFILLAACWLCRPGRLSRPRKYSDLVQHAALSGVGVILVIAGLEIALYAQSRQAVAAQHAMLASGIAVFSVISRSVLYRWLRQKARRMESPVLSAAAWHVGADALSSLVVTVGIATTWLGYSGLDSIAAALIGLVIACGGARLAIRGVAGLLRQYRDVRLYFNVESGAIVRASTPAEIERG
jgi:divalent metal cation (Fe/Co/Zn/Cd) transporter